MKKFSLTRVIRTETHGVMESATPLVDPRTGRLLTTMVQVTPVSEGQPHTTLPLYSSNAKDFVGKEVAITTAHRYHFLAGLRPIGYVERISLANDPQVTSTFQQNGEPMGRGTAKAIGEYYNR